MTRMAGPDCAVMCNLINTHTHTYTHIAVDLIVICEVTAAVLQSRDLCMDGISWDIKQTTVFAVEGESWEIRGLV